MTVHKKPAGPSDYAAIRESHLLDYGRKITKWGPRVLGEAYSDPRHFLLELLQNAEDALGRRKEKVPLEERHARFDLSDNELRFRHFGDPFTTDDVISICSIAETTKTPDNIGRFGLGFKSVYAYTARPEIHSGPEDFAISDFVHPEAVRPVIRQPHETVIVIPKKQGAGADAWNHLSLGFQQILDPVNLLFLRHIESVAWCVAGNQDAQIGRSSKHVANADATSPAVREVSIWNNNKKTRWLIFSQSSQTDNNTSEGHVEIAFQLATIDSDDIPDYSVHVLSESKLYAYFPTERETHLGFLVHGPYNTTPARDNVKQNAHNRTLISETAVLLRSALNWMRDNYSVNADLLTCLPLTKDKFTNTIFHRIFEETKHALRNDGLLPTNADSYAAADGLRLGRGGDLRALFAPAELGELYGSSVPLEWVDSSITRDSRRVVHDYLRHDLGIEELDPESMIPRLSTEFLAHRSDAWVKRLYEFLDGHSSQKNRRLLMRKPILRLSSRDHVTPPQEDAPGVFLPTEGFAGLRTLHPAVCGSEEAKRFLASVGVHKPDFVHHVIEHVIPKYAGGTRRITPNEYRTDLDAILRAHATDSRQAHDHLVNRLSQAQWLQALDGNGTPAGWLFPQELYLPTSLLWSLFQGVKEVHFLDRDALPRALLDAQDLLEKCGVASTLRIRHSKLVGQRLSRVRAELLEHESIVDPSGYDLVVDGLSAAIQRLATDTTEVRIKRSKALWCTLCEAWRRRGESDWDGEVSWSYRRAMRSRRFVSNVITLLRTGQWVAANDGALLRPKEVVFSDLDLDDEPALRDKLQFVTDEEKTIRDGTAILIALRDRYGISTVDQLSFRLDVQPSNGTDELRGVKLDDIVAWWDQVKMEERRKYSTASHPKALDIPSLAAGGADRVGWFTLFALACFRSYGRTTEGQHKGFVEAGVREGWWRSLAESRPPKDFRIWLDRLQAWSAADQTGEQYGMWRGSFVALYTVARYLDGYIHLMLNLPRIVEEAPRPPSLADVLRPTYSPHVRKLAVEAAPLDRILGIGVNWMIRELLRYGVYERRGVMVPYAWMSSQQVRDLLERAGAPSLTEPDPDHSRQIHEFVVNQIGAEAAEFDGDYDLALHRWSRRGQQ